jgi:hypothetical protein
VLRQPEAGSHVASPLKNAVLEADRPDSLTSPWVSINHVPDILAWASDEMRPNAQGPLRRAEDDVIKRAGRRAQQTLYGPRRLLSGHQRRSRCSPRLEPGRGRCSARAFGSPPAPLIYKRLKSPAARSRSILSVLSCT